MVSFMEILESTWLPIIYVCIFFIFIMLFRDLGAQTRRLAKWERITYHKTIAKVSMSFQHFTRKGELLTNTSQNICRSVHKDLTNLLQVSKGLTDKQLDEVLENKMELEGLFSNPNVVEFLYNPIGWLQTIQPEKSFIEKIFSSIKVAIKDADKDEEYFLIELATVVNNFRKALES